MLESYDRTLLLAVRKDVDLAIASPPKGKAAARGVLGHVAAAALFALGWYLRREGGLAHWRYDGRERFIKRR